MSITLDGTNGITFPDSSQISGGYTAKAWVSFNGTGTVAIRASGNVSSITDNGTGKYTVNFTTAMPDANYSVTGLPGQNSSTESMNTMEVISTAAGSVQVGIYAESNSSKYVRDVPVVTVAVFR